MLNGFRGYNTNSGSHEYDFKELRKSIYENNKEAINKDLNADLVKENKELKKEVRRLLDSMRVNY